MSDSKVRLSSASLKVLRLFVDTPRQGRSGAEISRITSVGAGTLYPMLVRLEDAGWLKGEWEDVDPSKAGRPRRRVYRITGVGQTEARAALEPFQIGNGALQWN